MARYCFFSFDYKDVKNFKVNVVRNSWLINRSPETFVDGSIWEAKKLVNPTEIKTGIDPGMNKTSVTCVLIGENTSTRRFVKYESYCWIGDEGHTNLGSWIEGAATSAHKSF